MSTADVSGSPIPSEPAASSSTSPILRWICTSNPFYAVSAALFLVGLRLSFGGQSREIDSWALMGGLAGYTLLLAGAALVLVRFAGVWNDVRTVLLLVVLMFLATSVTFDELLVLDPPRGIQFYVGGLLFSMALTEGLLRAIRLQLPLLFRVPYHLLLLLFFLYPVMLSPLVQVPQSEALMWGLWGFAPAAGVVFLTLLPAIRRGPDYVRGNGSPWPWPYFPWSVFVFFAVAVGGRAFLLCWSLHLLPGNNELIFGLYFLVPFGFALAVLVLELGLVARNRFTQAVALILPAGLVVLAALGHRGDATYAGFLRHFHVRLGGMPPFLALVTAGGFYLYAAARGVWFALDGFTVVVALFAVIGPDTLTISDITAIHPAPIAAAALLQLALGLWRSSVLRLALGVSVPGGWALLAGLRGYRELRSEVAGLDYLVVSLALLPLAVLISLGKAGVLRRWAAGLRR